MNIADECSAVRIVSVQSAVRPDPQHPILVLKDGADIVIAQTCAVIRRMAEAGELFRGRIEAVKSASQRSDPQESFPVLEDLHDGIVAESFEIARVGLEYGESVTVVPVQSVKRTEPKIASAVLQDREDGALGESLFNGNMLELHSGIPAVRRSTQKEGYSNEKNMTELRKIFHILRVHQRTCLL